MLRSTATAFALLGLAACATAGQNVVVPSDAHSDPSEWTSWDDARSAPPLSGSIATGGADLRPSSRRVRAADAPHATPSHDGSPEVSQLSAPPVGDLESFEEDPELAFVEDAAAIDADDLGDDAAVAADDDDEALQTSVPAVARGAGTTAATAGSTKAKASRATGTKAKKSVGSAIARTASRWVGLRSLRTVSKKVPDDCSGLIRAAYGRHGIDVMNAYALPGDNAVTIIWRRAKGAGALRKRSPRPGDLVFFKETYDRNRDGRRNDGLTHIGIVEKVERDGTVTFIHRGGRGVVRARMNTKYPMQRLRADGHIYNDYLRVADGTTAPRLAGQLFVAYASPRAFLTPPRVAQAR